MESWEVLLERLHREFLRREQELRLLRSIDQFILQKRNLDESLSFIVTRAKDILQADHVHVLMRRTNSLETLYSSGRHDIGQIIPLESVTGTALTRGEQINVTDLSEPPYNRLHKDYEGAPETPMRSELATPIVIDQEPMGILNAESSEVAHFTSADERICEAIALQIAIAFEHSRLFGVRQFLDHVDELIFDLSDLKRGDENENAIQVALRRCVEELQGLRYVEIDAIQILFPEGDELQVVHSTNPQDEGLRVRIADSVSGRAVREARTVTVNDVERDPEYKRMLGNTIQSEIAVPVFLGKLPIAVINVESPDPIAFDRDYQRIILERFSREVAVMLAFAKLRTDVSNALEMQHANEVLIAIGDQVGNVVHTLNNTVGAMRYRVREIQQECGAQLQESDFLREAMEELLELSNRALSAPLEMRRRISQIDIFDLNGSIQSIVKDMNLPEKIQVVWDLSPDDARVRCFSFDLVIRNLVQNAVEAMPDGGRLRLATRVITFAGTSGGYTEVIVSDSGRGIDAAARSRLFDINFTTKKEKKGKGLGFGLWWIRQFILRVNGEISVAPGEEGQGTSFIVKLPLADNNS